MVNFSRIKKIFEDIELKPHHYEHHWFQKKPTTSPRYIVHRWLLFIFFIVVCILSITDENEYPKESRPKWLIFLTNWGCLLNTAQSGLGTIIVQRSHIKKFDIDDGRKKIPIWYQVYHVMHVLAIVTSSTITVVYWAAVYNPEVHKLDATNILVHGGNAIAMYFDNFIVRFQWQMKHIIWPVLLGVLYSFFSFAYCALGGTDKHGNLYIYSILDWKKPGKSLGFCSLATALQIFFHCLIYIIYRLRKKYLKHPDANRNSTSICSSQQEQSMLDA